MTAPPFSELLKLCGLSLREAALFLNISPSSADKMSRGARSTPPGVSEALRYLHARIYTAASNQVEEIDRLARIGTDPDDIVICTYTDEEAIKEGWPCAAPLNRVTYMAAALTPFDVRIEPYGRDPWYTEGE